VQQANIAVYAMREDLLERGIGEDELIPGVRVMGRSELGKLVDQFDTVWNW
jgi:sulfur relay (sulfurtransferase) DsrF/TusC family protein